MKRAAEEEVASEAVKRRYWEMTSSSLPSSPLATMPGAWPEDTDILDNVVYSSLNPSPPRKALAGSASSKPRLQQQKRAISFPFPTEAVRAILHSVLSRRILAIPLSIIKRLSGATQAESQKSQVTQITQTTQDVQQALDTQETQEAQETPAKKTRQAKAPHTPPPEKTPFNKFFELPQAIARSPRPGRTPPPHKFFDFPAAGFDTPKPATPFKELVESPETFVPTPITRQNLPRSYIGEHKRQLLHRLHRLPPGFGSGKYDPASIISTPARVQKTPKTPSRWSPYHYEHGVTRPARSILRTSKPTHKPFESKIFIPSPQKYIDEDESPIDEEGDLQMGEADVPKKSTKIKFSGRQFSWLTGEKLDGKHGVFKYYYPELGINEPLGPQYMGYRDIKPEFDPDASFLDSPKPRGFDQEQENSPSKGYTNVVDDGLTSTMASWYKSAGSRDVQMSAAMEARYAEAREERAMEEMRERHAKEQAIRDEIAKKRKEEHEAMMARVREQEEKERAEKIQRDLEEAAEAERRLEAMLELEAQVEAERENRRAIMPQNFDMAHPLVQKVAAALDTNNPDQVVVQDGQLSRHDMGTLLPSGGVDSASGWLNDNIVNTALGHLVKAANARAGHDMKQTKTPAPFWAFNSGWFATVGPDGAGIKRWAAKRGVNLSGTNLLGAKKILFPVCMGAHWTITVLDVENRAIESMNSMDTDPRSGYNAKIGRLVLAWVKFELKDQYIPCEWCARRPVTMLQSNAKDCGVFTVMNAIARVKNIPTWSMRKQVNAERMALARWFVGCLLVNGGFNGFWDLKVDFERRWEGAFMDDPDYLF